MLFRLRSNKLLNLTRYTGASDFGSCLNTVHLVIFGGLMDGVPSICATGGL